jgi:hypothetical protein
MTKHTRSSAPASDAELALMQGDDDSGVDVQAFAESIGKRAPVNHDPQNILGWLLEHFGPSAVITRGDWQLLLNPVAATALRTAEGKREIVGRVQRVTYMASGHHQEFFHDGIAVQTAVDYLRKNHISIESTQILATLQSITIDEAFPIAAGELGFGRIDDPSQVTGFKQCVQQLGIDGNELATALRERSIVGKDGSHQHGGYLTPDALRNWIVAKNIKPKWSPSLAARILRDRRLADAEASHRSAVDAAETSAAAARATSPIHQAFAKVNEWKSAEHQDAIAGRRNALRLYREILLRRKSPLENDVQVLAEVCVELDCKYADDKDPSVCKSPGCTHERFNLARVERDAAALDEAERLEQLAGTIEACRAEVRAAGEANSETEKRVKAELLAASRRWRSAFDAQAEAVAAPGRLQDLRRKHSHLFID